MSLGGETAREDLAFMRAVVTESGQFQRVAGELFLWAGLIYGLQCFGHWLNIVGFLPLPPQGQLALGIGPSVFFALVMCVVIWRVRKTQQAAPGVASRALNAAFQATGVGNLIMIFVFAYGAIQSHNMNIWLYEPVVALMFQGVAWYVAWVIRRRAWVGFVALGWFVATIVAGLSINNPAVFVLTIGAALVLLMALPGYAMMRATKNG